MHTAARCLLCNRTCLVARLALSQPLPCRSTMFALQQNLPCRSVQLVTAKSGRTKSAAREIPRRALRHLRSGDLVYSDLIFFAVYIAKNKSVFALFYVSAIKLSYITEQIVGKISARNKFSRIGMTLYLGAHKNHPPERIESAATSHRRSDPAQRSSEKRFSPFAPMRLVPHFPLLYSHGKEEATKNDAFCLTDFVEQSLVL